MEESEPTSGYAGETPFGEWGSLVSALYGAAPGHRVTHTYTAKGQLASLSFPGGGLESLAYDRDGRLTGRQQATSPLGTFRNDSYSHDARGKVVGVSGLNSMTVENAYSGMGHLVMSSVSNPGGNSYQEEWRLDGAGRILEQRQHTNTSVSQAYQYSGAMPDRLDTATPAAPSADGLSADSSYYWYDPAGDAVVNGTAKYISQAGVWHATEPLRVFRRPVELSAAGCTWCFPANVASSAGPRSADSDRAREPVLE